MDKWLRWPVVDIYIYITLFFTRSIDPAMVRVKFQNSFTLVKKIVIDVILR